MVKTIIVPKADMEILKKYIGNEEAVVLIDEAVLSELSDEQTAYIRKNDGNYANYGMGGEADVMVDLVQSTDHYFIDFLFPELDEDGEEE